MYGRKVMFSKKVFVSCELSVLSNGFKIIKSGSSGLSVSRSPLGPACILKGTDCRSWEIHCPQFI